MSRRAIDRVLFVGVGLLVIQLMIMFHFPPGQASSWAPAPQWVTWLWCVSLLGIPLMIVSLVFELLHFMKGPSE